MNIKETKEIQGVERNPKGQTGAASAAQVARRDRVTVEAGQHSEAISVAGHHTVALRNARLRDLESAIKAGRYRPDASQLADQLLDAAEIDAKLRAMLQG
jgi:anti-sigma28 factor (negative regulator of flagellin synthesis)